MPALIVEFDPLFLGGFALPAEVLNDRLTKYGLPDDDPYRFVRHVYGRPIGEALAGLLPASVDPAHVERRLAATYAALLQQNAQQGVEPIRAFFRPFARAGVRLALVTRLRPQVVAELLDGLPGEPTTTLDPTPLAAGLTPETLQTALVMLGLPVRQCFGLLACGVSVRAAVRVGLRAAAVPDPMVAFEGCTGADFVADTLTRHVVSKLRARLQPQEPRP